MTHHAKLERAQVHLKELAAGVQEFRVKRPYSISCEQDPETGEYVARLIHIEKLPEHWPLLIGDAIYNLRESLDHLAYALAGGINGDKTEFPVEIHATKPDGKRGKGWKALKSVLRPEAMDAVASLQPYQRKPGDPQGHEFHPLWQLHELNRIDKHRHLLAVAT